MAVSRPLIRSDLASLDVSYRPEEDIEYRLTIIPVFRTGHSQLRTQFYESRFGAKRIEVGVVELVHRSGHVQQEDQVAGRTLLAVHLLALDADANAVGNTSAGATWRKLPREVSVSESKA